MYKNSDMFRSVSILTFDNGRTSMIINNIHILFIIKLTINNIHILFKIVINSCYFLELQLLKFCATFLYIYGYVQYAQNYFVFH